MVSVAVSAVVSSGIADNFQRLAADNIQVQLVPMFRPWMPSRCFVSCLVLKEVICNGQLVVTA